MLDRLLGETIHLVTVTAPNLGSVKADPGQVEQILLNLAVNARDAMPDGGRLTIQTADRTVGEDEAARYGIKPGPYVMLEVKDTGVGMDADVMAHVFEPFFTTKGHGTGLGLSTVYGIVNQSGGHIRVDSELGQRHDVPGLPAARRGGRARGRRRRHDGDRDRRAAEPVAGRDHPPRRGRGARARGRAGDPRDAGLRGDRGAPRSGGAHARSRSQGSDPPADHRRGDARDERA
jgi:signal transduction histidine kinase